MVHLIDNSDTTNAKFVFLRVPEGIKATSEPFKKVWQVAKALKKNDFASALAELSRMFSSPIQEANAMKEALLPLKQVLEWHLTHHTVPSLLKESYSSIEFAKLKSMLGSPADLNSLSRASDLLETAQADAQGFVSLKPK